MQVLADNIKANLESNRGRISPDFIDNLAENGEVTYTQLTPSIRVCVIRIYSGHEVIGVAQVLDHRNDVEEIGNSVAFTNAKNELWSVCSSIAKVL